MTDPFDRAAGLVRDGGVIAYPTEAVYGLGCDPSNEDAVMRLLGIKSRSVFEGLILIAASVAQLEPFIEPLTPAIESLVMPTWPGPHTWVVPARADTPLWLRGRHSGIAVRVTAHPAAAALCERAGTALVSTSANLHGEAPARTAAEAGDMFGDSVDYIVPGDTGGQERPSAIRDAVSGVVVRPA